MKKTAAIYLRCSTPDQVYGSSLERQLRYCKIWLEIYNVECIDIISDVGSGWEGTHLAYHTSVRKGNLGRLLKGYEHGFAQVPDYLIYESEDRLCRDYKVSLEIHRHLRKLGIQAESTCPDRDEDLWSFPLSLSEKMSIYQL